MAVASPGADPNGSKSGNARIYDWDGARWTQVGVDIEGEAVNDSSGFAIAMSTDGNRIAVGAFSNDGNGFDSCHVRVYDWDGTTWNQVGTDIDGEGVTDYFGYSVAMSGDGNRIAVGAHLNDGNGSNSGHVRIYDWKLWAWTQVGTDINGEAVSDASGRSGAMPGDGYRIAIGAI